MKGCLISILQMRGGERWPGGASEMRRVSTLPAVQAASSRRASRASPGSVMTALREWSRSAGADLGPKRWIGMPRNPRESRGCLKRSAHRGRCGANLKHRARDAFGSGGTAALSGLDKPRCREASGPAGPSGPTGVPRALLFGARRNLEGGLPGADQRTRAMTHVCYPSPAGGGWTRVQRAAGWGPNSSRLTPHPSRTFGARHPPREAGRDKARHVCAIGAWRGKITSTSQSPLYGVE
jgi:hypothetical protein